MFEIVERVALVDLVCPCVVVPFVGVGNFVELVDVAMMVGDVVGLVGVGVCVGSVVELVGVGVGVITVVAADDWEGTHLPDLWQDEFTSEKL